MPEALFRRAKETCARKRMTFRDLVAAAVEHELIGEREPFVLRDAAAGYATSADAALPAVRINEAIDALREEQPGP